ncbi:ATP-binding protein [Rhodoplanes roseus]|uniref:Rad50/SbcC-type AAA domain-containing protein n=1 Tax=Rhodoplanes roseus TaxID=29409 RepID=A0A327L7A8_9BRAD|nr:AAA family ATPase [Rhodoplanes roseus]RAI45382.1 hypothetical protein CH341_04295 [Rhodoplanes roseus]
MADFEAKPLHLHSLDSLLADLVSGRAVLVADGQPFTLGDRERSALQWYRERGSSAWKANVIAANGEDFVDAVSKPPPELPVLPARPANANSRRLTLKTVEAHRFAGLHKFGTPDAAPPDYRHDFSSLPTLFEGRNGSGKTSLINAIVWALTGEILRPQREPEKAKDEFECWVQPDREDAEPTAHRLSPVTPMPNTDQYRPDRAWVPADTWVELTFVDQNGAAVPQIRRTQRRSPLGKLTEDEPDLSVLGIDPIAVRIGSVMPALLPLIKVGSESELGRAVSQLTGLSGLVDLADHARRLKKKIADDLRKAKTRELQQADVSYSTAQADLAALVKLHPAIAPSVDIPSPSNDAGIEAVVEQIVQHFEHKKTAAYQSARSILGSNFDPADSALRTNLEQNIGLALDCVKRLSDLPAVSRLNALKALSGEQIDEATAEIATILESGKTLEALARDPSTAARARLYAHIVTWRDEHPDPARDEGTCVVCGSPLAGAIDPVSGRPVLTHIHDVATDAALLSQTLSKWSGGVLGRLLQSLPEPLRPELSVDLPEHPCDLLRTAIVDELFKSDSFGGVLASLQSGTAAAYDRVTAERAPLAEELPIVLPTACRSLEAALKRLDKALRFARWRQDNDILVRKVATSVLGRRPKEGESAESETLVGKLLDLDRTVRAAKPIADALTQCSRLKASLKARRSAEKRLTEYDTAQDALTDLLALGDLADQQVNVLRRLLSTEAAAWRNRIYLGAFPDTAHELVDTAMGRKGEIDLTVRTGGVSAPAQHVTNASALRASLVSFYLAFWEHVLNTRGGLRTMLLDDPQELLDDENRERLATSLGMLVRNGAQLIVTSYDPRFALCMARFAVAGGVIHFEVHPATLLQPVIRTTPPLAEITKRREAHEADKNAEEPARAFVDACRVYLEAKVGDLFDDPAHSEWVMQTPSPTLAPLVARLRTVVSANPQGMFAAHVFRRFVAHPALEDGSPVLILMNKSHHGRRQEIRAADVAQCTDDLATLLELAEQMHEECYRWRRRDAHPDTVRADSPPALTPFINPILRVEVCPDLAAFTQNAPEGETQEIAEPLDRQLLDGKVMFYLRRPYFGFAAPAGALAIAEAVPGPCADRRLVIARHGASVYARRFLRGKDGGAIGLTAETVDPRSKTPKTVFLPETQVSIHQVVGIIFDHDLTLGQGPEEAVEVDAQRVFERVRIAYRVVDESAVPLALNKQIVLGAECIELSSLGNHEGELVALSLDDGSSIFKRVGAVLPDDLSNLRQFESIGGLGVSQVLSVGKDRRGFRRVVAIRKIMGVLYHG